MKVTAGDHFDVNRGRWISGHGCTPGMGDIESLSCRFCDFRLPVNLFRHLRDKSGLPKYNRTRAKMARHLHQEHRDQLTANGAGVQ